jgi:hypothetical protein
VEVGIVGLVFMLAASAAQLWAAHRARGLGPRMVVMRAAEAACYGLLATSFFSDVLWHKFFWLPWILVAWGLQERQEPGPLTKPAEPIAG